LKLKKMTENINPITQTSMANKLNTSQQVVSYQINHVLGKKLVQKPKGHILTAKMVGKRYRRSWPLYRLLRGQRWQKVITTDEAWFYLDNTSEQTKVQYISRGQKRSSLQSTTKSPHPKGVMVWAGISANGCTEVRFVKPGAKVNADYYIKHVLTPFVKHDIPKLYPNGDYLFQQDSAPSHTAKKTIKFLKDKKIPFITPLQWIPNSPDGAPCDFFLWGVLKQRVRKRKVKTIRGLKKAIKEELKKIPQNMINKALKSWPKRCRQIYYKKGLHIEKHN